MAEMVKEVGVNMDTAFVLVVRKERVKMVPMPMGVKGVYISNRNREVQRLYINSTHILVRSFPSKLSAVLVPKICSCWGCWLSASRQKC